MDNQESAAHSEIESPAHVLNAGSQNNARTLTLTSDKSVINFGDLITFTAEVTTPDDSDSLPGKVIFQATPPDVIRHSTQRSIIPDALLGRTAVITSPAHGLINEPHVTITGFAIAAYNVSDVPVTVIDANHFSYVVTHAAEATTADTNGIITTGKVIGVVENPLLFCWRSSITSNVATLSTTVAHGFSTGDKAYVRNNQSPAYTTTGAIVTVIDQYTFSYPVTHANDPSGGIAFALKATVRLVAPDRFGYGGLDAPDRGTFDYEVTATMQDLTSNTLDEQVVRRCPNTSGGLFCPELAAFMNSYWSNLGNPYQFAPWTAAVFSSGNPNQLGGFDGTDLGQLTLSAGDGRLTPDISTHYCVRWCTPISGYIVVWTKIDDIYGADCPVGTYVFAGVMHAPSRTFFPGEAEPSVNVISTFDLTTA